MTSSFVEKKLTVAMVAGEASGDLLAGLLLDGLRQQWPQLVACGIGGNQMQQRGFQSWWPSERLSVHGYSMELVRRLLGIVKIRRSLRAKLLASPPDVFVGVDAPDFNLGLEADLRAAGIKTVHFVCPSVWAWRAKRLTKIHRSADLVLCVFPFEPALLAQHQINATYVGHPLASVIPMQPDRSAARNILGLPLDADVLAILPGSRSTEVQYITPRFLEAAALILKLKPEVKLVVPAVPALKAQIEKAVVKAGLQNVVQVVEGQSHTVLAACDATLIASGTATLEAALMKRPMVIGYRMHPISWWLMKRRQLQPWVGLPNILCQDFVVPELIQDEGSAAALADACLYWLDAKHHQPSILLSLEQRFSELHQLLQRDTAQLAAHAIAKLI
jgi:lipid-A-disaccharide synthase